LDLERVVETAPEEASVSSKQRADDTGLKPIKILGLISYPRPKEHGY
jgi:hypothetical protein